MELSPGVLSAGALCGEGTVGLGEGKEVSALALPLGLERSQ